MKHRKRKYDEDMPFGRVQIVPNFLPPPEKLVFPSDLMKITLQLDLKSYIFFKEQAKKLRVPYQRMIREVLIRYAAQHSKKRAA
jgi:predicted DNA binding CopG/RHH family protein